MTALIPLTFHPLTSNSLSGSYPLPVAHKSAVEPCLASGLIMSVTIFLAKGNLLSLQQKGIIVDVALINSLWVLLKLLLKGGEGAFAK